MPGCDCNGRDKYHGKSADELCRILLHLSRSALWASLIILIDGLRWLRNLQFITLGPGQPARFSSSASSPQTRQRICHAPLLIFSEPVAGKLGLRQSPDGVTSSRPQAIIDRCRSRSIKGKRVVFARGNGSALDEFADSHRHPTPSEWVQRG